MFELQKDSFFSAIFHRFVRIHTLFINLSSYIQSIFILWKLFLTLFFQLNLDHLISITPLHSILTFTLSILTNLSSLLFIQLFLSCHQIITLWRDIWNSKGLIIFKEYFFGVLWNSFWTVRLSVVYNQGYSSNISSWPRPLVLLGLTKMANYYSNFTHKKYFSIIRFLLNTQFRK